MADNFHIYVFKGLILHKCKGNELMEMSLEKCFKDVFNTWYDSDTKRFFENRNFSFACVEFSAEELWKEVENGMAIFSISENTSIEEVKNYMKMGLSPVFMRAMELKKLKKVWG